MSQFVVFSRVTKPKSVFVLTKKQTNAFVFASKMHFEAPCLHTGMSIRNVSTLVLNHSIYVRRRPLSIFIVNYCNKNESAAFVTKKKNLHEEAEQTNK
jgi:hypothetical protein